MSPLPRREAGAALIVAIIFLLLLSTLALTGLRARKWCRRRRC
jgi:Tfp pilus assembly protein PilX